MNIASWQRLRWASRVLAMPVPEPAQQAARILAVQRNIVLPLRLLLMGVVFYYLFDLRWLPASPQQAVFLETLQSYFIFYICIMAIAAILMLLRRFPSGLVQWVVFVVGLLDGLLLAGLTVENGGFGSALFWIFPGLIILNSLSIPLAMPQIVLNLSLSAFYLGAGILNSSSVEQSLPGFVDNSYIQPGSSVFSAGEIKDLPVFVGKLKAHSDPVSAFLWGQFTEGGRQAVEAYTETDAGNKAAEAVLVEELNKIIRAGPIYKDSIFPRGSLTLETRKLLEDSTLRGERLLRLNRMLLEDVFPAEIARKRRFNSKLGKWMQDVNNKSDQPAVEQEPGAEPFMLRLIILWLLTGSCYAVQLLAFRDREAAQEALEAAARNSELRAAGRLAAEIAHQLKNPLGIINNTVFSLRRSMRSPKQEVLEQLEIIREEIDRADRIITQLMGYSQLSEGRVEKLSVPEEVDRAVAEAFPPAANYVTQIHRDFGPNLPALMMQRIHLSAVLVNLLQNAREALNGRGDIHISAQTHGDNAIELIIADDGPGIAADKVGRIFDAYFTSKSRGTGLGLAIVKHNVELYGGTVNVESKLGKGARFILLFPARTFVK